MVARVEDQQAKWGIQCRSQLGLEWNAEASSIVLSCKYRELGVLTSYSCGLRPSQLPWRCAGSLFLLLAPSLVALAVA